MYIPDFSDFYSNEFIKQIANNERWTVSTSDKLPIDMYTFKYHHAVKGALFTDSKSLVTLPELVSLIPNAANHAYYLDSLLDKFVVLDIEPKCPDDIKQKLLKTPYIYGEVSMSGKGYHLIFPLPDCFKDYPIALKKKVMKEKHGYYEILLQHYVTFTRNLVSPAVGTEKFEPIFIDLASKQTETSRVDVNINELKPEIPNEKHLHEILCHLDYKKTPADFYDDISKYEYGFMGFLYYNLKRQLNLDKYKNHTYTANERAWLLFTIAQDKIPYRPKHDEHRNNLPWLLYLASEIIAKDV